MQGVSFISSEGGQALSSISSVSHEHFPGSLPPNCAWLKEILQHGLLQILILG